MAAHRLSDEIEQLRAANGVLAKKLKERKQQLDELKALQPDRAEVQELRAQASRDKAEIERLQVALNNAKAEIDRITQPEAVADMEDDGFFTIKPDNFAVASIKASAKTNANMIAKAHLSLCEFQRLCTELTGISAGPELVEAHKRSQEAGFWLQVYATNV